MTTPLADDVDTEQVQGLMAGRLPGDVVSEDGSRFALFLTTVRGVAAEVTPLAGDLGPGPRRDLAVWAVALGTAASLEGSLYPEQQGLGDTGLSSALARRYAAVLAQLRGSLPTDGGDVDSDNVPTPLGTFPPAPIAPDPNRLDGYYPIRRTAADWLSW